MQQKMRVLRVQIPCEMLQLIEKSTSSNHSISPSPSSKIKYIKYPLKILDRQSTTRSINLPRIEYNRWKKIYKEKIFTED